MIERHCPRCNAEKIANARFCQLCGFRFEQSSEITKVEKRNESGVASVFILYFSMLLVCAILKFTKIDATYAVMNVVDAIFCVTILVFAARNRKELFDVLRFRNIKWWLIPIVIILAIGANLGLSYLMDFIHKMNNEYYSFYMYEDTSHPLLWSILLICLQPAIFEELAFRGVMYNYLDKVMDPKAVLIVTGFLFAILHLAPISIVWLLPFGIFTAWMRKKSGHLYYGIVFHFFFNLTAVMIAAFHYGWLKDFIK